MTWIDIFTGRTALCAIMEEIQETNSFTFLLQRWNTNFLLDCSMFLKSADDCMDINVSCTKLQCNYWTIPQYVTLCLSIKCICLNYFVPPVDHFSWDKVHQKKWDKRTLLEVRELKHGAFWNSWLWQIKGWKNLVSGK